MICKTMNIPEQRYESFSRKFKRLLQVLRWRNSYEYSFTQVGFIFIKDSCNYTKQNSQKKHIEKKNAFSILASHSSHDLEVLA